MPPLKYNRMPSFKCKYIHWKSKCPVDWNWDFVTLNTNLVALMVSSMLLYLNSSSVYSIHFSLFQYIPVYFKLFQSIPVSFSLFQFISLYFSLFRSIPPYCILFQSISVNSGHFNLFQSIPVISSLFQSIPVDIMLMYLK